MKPEQALQSVRSIYAWATEVETPNGLDIIRDAVGAEHVVLARWERSEVNDDQPLSCSALSNEELVSLTNLWRNGFAESSVKRMPIGGAFRLSDAIPLQAIIQSRGYQEVVRNVDGGLGASKRLMTGEVTTALFICRSAKRGLDFTDEDLKTIDLLAHHVVDANEIRLRLERGKKQESESHAILDLVDDAVVVLNESGQIVFVNREADILFSTSSALSVASGHVKAAEYDCDRRLQTAIRQVLDSHSSTATESDQASLLKRLTVRQDRGLPLTVKIFPGVGCGNRRVGTAQAVVLLITNPEKAIRLRAEELAVQFELSDREAQLASLICAGATVKAASTEMAVSIGTARQYLKSVFNKTGVGRQSDLIRLIRS